MSATPIENKRKDTDAEPQDTATPDTERREERPDTETASDRPGAHSLEADSTSSDVLAGTAVSPQTESPDHGENDDNAGDASADAAMDDDASVHADEADERREAQGGALSGADMRRVQRLRQAKQKKAKVKERRSAEAFQEGFAAEKALRGRFARLGVWVGKNRGLTLAAIVGVGVIITAGFFWQQSSQRSDQEVTASVEDALKTSLASVGDSDASDGAAGAEEGGKVFASVKERAEATVRAWSSIRQGGSPARLEAWTRLVEAAALVQAGKHEEARPLLTSAVSSHGKDPLIAWRSAEIFAQVEREAGKWDAARGHYERLLELGDGAFAFDARLAIARLVMEEGNHAKADDLLVALQQDLRKTQAESPPEGPLGGGRLSKILSEVDQEIRWVRVASKMKKETRKE